MVLNRVLLSANKGVSLAYQTAFIVSESIVQWVAHVHPTIDIALDPGCTGNHKNDTILDQLRLTTARPSLLSSSAAEDHQSCPQLMRLDLCTRGLSHLYWLAGPRG